MWTRGGNWIYLFMMADKTKKGVFILLVMSIVGIFVVFEDDATAKEMWDSVQHSLRFGPPCSCYKCVTEEDDVWFMERFNESVHPFLTPENILTEPNFYWWKTLMYDYFSLTDYRIAEKKVFALFPYNENFMDSQPDRCRTCAVVGNSINLLGSRYGPLIDYNDVVIRFNQAPIKGYEKDVGNKTTIHIMYPESATDLDNNTNLVFFPFKSKDLQWLISAFTEGSITFTYKTVKAKIKANKNLVKIINPYFMKYVHESWLKRRGRVPSTGFMGLILALHICDEVNVFGFGVDENGNWRIYWEELKNKLFGTGFHSGSLEYKLIRQLSERQKINFFKGW